MSSRAFFLVGYCVPVDSWYLKWIAVHAWTISFSKMTRIFINFDNFHFFLATWWIIYILISFTEPFVDRNSLWSVVITHRSPHKRERSWVYHDVKCIRQRNKFESKQYCMTSTPAVEMELAIKGEEKQIAARRKTQMEPTLSSSLEQFV